MYAYRHEGGEKKELLVYDLTFLLFFHNSTGARNLVLTSRSGVRTGYQAHRISCWREQGVRVLVSKRDVCKQEGAELLIQESQQMGAVGGIFNLAMVR